MNSKLRRRPGSARNTPRFLLLPFDGQPDHDPAEPQAEHQEFDGHSHLRLHRVRWPGCIPASTLTLKGEAAACNARNVPAQVSNFPPSAFPPIRPSGAVGRLGAAIPRAPAAFINRYVMTTPAALSTLRKPLKPRLARVLAGETWRRLSEPEPDQAVLAASIVSFVSRRALFWDCWEADELACRVWELVLREIGQPEFYDWPFLDALAAALDGADWPEIDKVMAHYRDAWRGRPLQASGWKNFRGVMWGASLAERAFAVHGRRAFELLAFDLPPTEHHPRIIGWEVWTGPKFETAVGGGRADSFDAAKAAAASAANAGCSL